MIPLAAIRSAVFCRADLRTAVHTGTRPLAQRLPAALVWLVLAQASCGEDAPPALRHEPVAPLSVPTATERIRQLGLFDAHLNPEGRGIENRLQPAEDGVVVLDAATGLVWQRGGSPDRRTFGSAEAYVESLRQDALGGYDDWRLPTLEEALSLNQPELFTAGLHLDPAFGEEVWWIWTCDRESLVGRWVIDFASGSAFVHVPVGGSAYIRAVRSL